MATDVLAMAQGYVAALQQAGIRAVLNPADINPPCVWVRAPVMRFRFGRGCVSADWEARLYLIDSGYEQALKTAVPLITQIQEALNFAVVEAVPADWALPDGGTVPGYLFNWTT